MMRSMYSGVSGLRTHQTKMDVIGNNIANVNTVGYKSQRVTFNEIFSQTLQGASSANADTGRGGLNPMQVGLGVNVSSIDMLMTPGAAQRTDNPFDIMVGGDGSGFIVVGDASGTYFTRAGALRMDDDGNLIIPNGMKVQGWQADAKGESIIRSNVSDIKLDSPQNKTASAEATTGIDIVGNLNIADALNPKTGEMDPDGIPIQLRMYDSLGNRYTMNMKALYNPGPDASTDPAMEPESWLMLPVMNAAGETKFTDQSGKEYYVAIESLEDIQFKFDTAGNLDPDFATSFTIGSDDAAADPPNSFALDGVNSTLGPITVNFEDLTQVNGKTNVDPKAPKNKDLSSGREPGEMTGYGIGPDGIITAHYSNGERKLLGQVVIADFDNPAGLEKVGDNIYRETANSGDFDGIGNAGIFQSGVLEMSNVDLSQEFTEMITTQRGFQANSKIISTSDEMLHELVNLKR